jgi:hypothetical protein
MALLSQWKQHKMIAMQHGVIHLDLDSGNVDEVHSYEAGIASQYASLLGLSEHHARNAYRVQPVHL